MKAKGIIGWVAVIIVLTNTIALAAPVDHVYVSNERVDKLNLDGSLDSNFLASTLSTCRQLSVDGNNGNVWLGCEAYQPLASPGVGLFTSIGGLISYYSTSWNIAGGSCVDPFGNAWFTAWGDGRVLKYLPNGTFVNAYSVGGTGPIAVACDRLGNVWTANLNSNDISKLANNGSFISTYPSATQPDSIAVDSLDHVWVMTRQGNLYKYDINGNNLGSWFIEPSSGPSYIAIDNNDILWIRRPTNYIAKVDQNGNELGRYDLGTGTSDIAIDAGGNLWVVNRNSSTVTKLSNNGTNLGTFPLSGNSGQNDTGFLHKRFVLGYDSVDGPNVWVPINGGAPAGAVTLNFDYITTKGNSSYTESGIGTIPPAGFKLGTPNRYYDIISTAIYTDGVEVCIGYVETEFANEASLKLFHNSGTWADVTSSLDTTNNIICGDVTSLSEFAIMEPTGEGPIPTVSQWMLILMAVFLFVAIVRRFKPLPIRT